MTSTCLIHKETLKGGCLPICFRDLCDLIRNQESHLNISITLSNGFYQVTDGTSLVCYIEEDALLMASMLDMSPSPPATKNLNKDIYEEWWTLGNINDYRRRMAHHCFKHQQWNGKVQTETLPHDCFWAAVAVCESRLKYVNSDHSVRPPYCSNDGYLVTEGATTNEQIRIEKRLIDRNYVNVFTCWSNAGPSTNYSVWAYKNPYYPRHDDSTPKHPEMNTECEKHSAMEPKHLAKCFHYMCKRIRNYKPNDTITFSNGYYHLSHDANTISHIKEGLVDISMTIPFDLCPPPTKTHDLDTTEYWWCNNVVSKYLQNPPEFGKYLTPEETNEPTISKA